MPGRHLRRRTQHEGAHSTEAPAEPKELVALSEPEPVRGYATVGVTWKHGTDYSDDQIDVTVRTEENGKWSRWMPAEYHDEHGPDAGSAEENAGRERPGTDALVVGDVDRVQMRAETTDGSTPPDLKLAVIDPGTGAMTQGGTGDRHREAGVASSCGARARRVARRRSRVRTPALTPARTCRTRSRSAP